MFPLYESGRVMIDVRDCRAFVSRWESQADGTQWLMPASNAEALEDDAAAVLLDLGGGINLSGIYDCPADLASRARFAEVAP